MTTQKQNTVGAGSLGVTGGQRADAKALPASPSDPCDLTEKNVQSFLVTRVRFSTSRGFLCWRFALQWNSNTRRFKTVATAEQLCH